MRPITIELAEDTIVSGELVSYCAAVYAEEQRRFGDLKRYYFNQNDILTRIFSDTSLPNNKLVHCFAKYISNIATAYFMGRGLKYETEDESYKELLDELLSANYTDTQNFEEAKEMSITGVSYELLYINSEGDFRTKFFSASEIVPIYSSGIGSFLSMAVRFYVENNTDGSAVKYAEVYTKTEIIAFKGDSSGWTETGRKAHYMGDVPVIVRRNNSARKGDFEDVKSQIDAYDRAESDTLNDLDYFTDAYLKVTGVDEMVTEEEADGGVTGRQNKCMKQNRTLYFPEGGDAGFLIKEINDTATENFKNRVYKDIFFLSQVPNLTDETFAGNLSGIAMKYKLFGLEELANEKEKYWKSAERKKLKLITNFLNAMYSESYDWRDIKVSFDRSQIANTLEISQILNNLRDMLSNETLIGMFPGVDNVAEELQRLKEEKAADEGGGNPSGGVY